VGFKVFVLSAALEADMKQIRKILKSQKLRLASREELFAVAGVEKGAMPPFGRPIFELDLFVDTSIQRNSHIAFNAGALTKSFILSTEDYMRVSHGTLCKFSSPPVAPS
jgi:Ala-tRNA(Pro) deacylase